MSTDYPTYSEVDAACDNVKYAWLHVIRSASSKSETAYDRAWDEHVAAGARMDALLSQLPVDLDVFVCRRRVNGTVERLGYALEMPETDGWTRRDPFLPFLGRKKGDRFGLIGSTFYVSRSEYVGCLTALRAERRRIRDEHATFLERERAYYASLATRPKQKLLPITKFKKALVSAIHAAASQGQTQVTVDGTTVTFSSQQAAKW